MPSPDRCCQVAPKQSQQIDKVARRVPLLRWRSTTPAVHQRQKPLRCSAFPAVGGQLLQYAVVVLKAMDRSLEKRASKDKGNRDHEQWPVRRHCRVGHRAERDDPESASHRRPGRKTPLRRARRIILHA